MSKVNRFEDLRVWQAARDICKDVFKVITETDVKTYFKLRDQMDGSSGSIMDNIAEGYGRGGNKEFKTFLGYSRGSCTELKSQLHRCYDRGFITSEEHKIYCQKIESFLNQLSSLMNYLKKSDYKGSRLSEPETIYALNNIDKIEKN